MTQDLQPTVELYLIPIIILAIIAILAGGILLTIIRAVAVAAIVLFTLLILLDVLNGGTSLQQINDKLIALIVATSTYITSFASNRGVRQ